MALESNLQSFINYDADQVLHKSLASCVQIFYYLAEELEKLEPFFISLR